MNDAAFDDWVNEARDRDLLDVARGAGAQLRRTGAEFIGPCPVCGGSDRFAINQRKNVFVCRGSGASGDVIALARYLHACDFMTACEILTGRAPPKGQGESAAERAAREARMEARAREAAEQAARAEHEANSFRDAERRRAFDIFNEAGPLKGSVAERYLIGRGITATDGLRLRCLDQLGYYVPDGKGFRRIGAWPAMVAGIASPGGDWLGVHVTYLEPSGAGKASIIHPDSGEPCLAKKIRGSHRGGVIRLVGLSGDRAVMGEGIETTLSMRQGLIAAGRDLSGVLFWAGVSLGNMAGRHAGSVRHPDGLTMVDKAGRERVRRIAGPEPAEDAQAIVLPERIRSLVLLGDGDSEHWSTLYALTRGGRRFMAASEGRRAAIAWARSGGDFNDMLRAAG